MKKKQTIYIGNASSKGIIYFHFQDGKIENIKYTNDERRCTYLESDGKNIYGTIEIDGEEDSQGGYVVSYKKENNNLIKKDKKKSHGKGPCHIEVKNDKIAISHYTDGFFNVFEKKKDGNIGKMIFYSRENNFFSHMHYSKIQGNYIFKIDLGNDELLVDKIERNNIKQITKFKFPKGTQPRHMVIAKDELFVVTEKSCLLYILKFEKEKLNIKQIYSIIPKNKNKDDTGCAIKISKDENYIYITLRGKNLVCVFKRNRQNWELIQYISCYGKTPRDIALDKDEKYILVANQDSNEISIFSREHNTGKISFIESKSIDSPTCILIGEEEQ